MKKMSLMILVFIISISVFAEMSTSSNGENSSTIDESTADWASVAIPAFAGDGKKWELQQNVSDEFNYEAAASSSLQVFNGKWKNEYVNGWTGMGGALYSKEHSHVTEGNLCLENDFVAGKDPNLVKYYADNQIHYINTGNISSLNTVVYPVFAEIRVKMNEIPMASDFWMITLDQTQEIDVLEAFGTDRAGYEWWNTQLHLSHHTFIREPYQDYQPMDGESWYKDNGRRWSASYFRIGIYWKGPFELEYYVDGEMVRSLYYNAVADKVGSTWKYSYQTMTNGVITKTGGYDAMTVYSTSTKFSQEKLEAASKASSVNIIDAYNHLNGSGLNKESYLLFCQGQQPWSGICPSYEELNDEEKSVYKVDWIRVYKPVSSIDGDAGNGESTGTTIPGKIQAENYNAMNAIQTENTSDVDGGKNVGWVDTGDWMDYNINVATAGTYTVDFRVASKSSNIKFNLKNGDTILTSVNSSSTGGWQTWKTISKTINLLAGNQTLRIYASGPSWNINWFEIKSDNNTEEESNSGSSITIEAESFTNTGGTFNDVVVPNGANKTESTINFVNKNDWMDYNISIPEDGAYEIVYYISSPITGSTIKFGMGTNVWNTTTVPNNGEWDTYQTLKASNTANFTKGNHVIRISAGGTDWTWNLDKLKMNRVSNMKSGKILSSNINNKESLKVYPNPASDVLNIKLGNVSGNIQLTLYNSIGIPVFNEIITNTELYVLDISMLNKGFYTIKVGEYKIQRVIIE